MRWQMMYRYQIPWSTCAYHDHDFCIVDIVKELVDRGYTCYLEFEVFLTIKHKIVIDVCAMKQGSMILIEVGTLSPRKEGDRITLLKALFPSARIVHITQWKNWGIITYRWVETFVDLEEMGKSLLKGMGEQER
jgi:hypothetical protein